MESHPAMRLRMLIELLAALILTFAALLAISRMAKATGIKVENAYARHHRRGSGAFCVTKIKRLEGAMMI
jgi:hypothetical protein